jgi:protein tyrosine/serine phosphatase
VAEKYQPVPAGLRWTFGLAIGVLVTVVPFLAYRWSYTHAKRLREIVAGRVYRSGQMTAEGFREAVERLHLRTIINLQEDYPDPDVALGYFTIATMKESELCRQLGVDFRFIPPDTLPHNQAIKHHPEAIDRFLEIMDNPAAYPVLIHCRAGLHRTGCMAAVYRMEYQCWSADRAFRELKANGFGEWPCSSANDYVAQYVLDYRPRWYGGSATTHQTAKPHESE